MKTVCVAELQKVAFDLGAKHFRVSLIDETSVHSKLSAKAHLKEANKQEKVSMSESVDHSSDSSVRASATIVKEMDCPGHDPVTPSLKYLAHDPEICSLIDLCMDPASRPHHLRCNVDLVESSGIKHIDAANIDAAISTLKLGANFAISQEVNKQSNHKLCYEVDF